MIEAGRVSSYTSIALRFVLFVRVVVVHSQLCQQKAVLRSAKISQERTVVDG
jgi:hypothetical protein